MSARISTQVSRIHDATLLLTALICLAATAHAATGLRPPEALAVVGAITALTLAFFWTGRAVGLDRM